MFINNMICDFNTERERDRERERQRQRHREIFQYFNVPVEYCIRKETAAIICS